MKQNLIEKMFRRNPYAWTKPMLSEQNVESLKTQMHLDKFILEQEITQVFAKYIVESDSSDDRELIATLWVANLEKFMRNNLDYNAHCLMDYLIFCMNPDNEDDDGYFPLLIQ